MNTKMRRWLRPVLFALGGAFVGLGYYCFIGCASGSCPITSNPISSMAYMGVIGWLIGLVFTKEGEN